MPTDLILILAALLVVSVLGFAVAWVALTPKDVGSKEAQLELSLTRIEREAQNARQLVRARR